MERLIEKVRFIFLHIHIPTNNKQTNNQSVRVEPLHDCIWVIYYWIYLDYLHFRT